MEPPRKEEHDRFITDEMARADWQVGENRVQRLCAEHRIFSVTTRKGRRAAGKLPGPAVHDDHVRVNSPPSGPTRSG